MIRKVSIKGYRSCVNTSFVLHPNLSVLIGPNSSGKTNVLNGVLLLKELLNEGFRRQYHYEETPTGQCSLNVQFDVGGKKIILNAVIDILTDDNNHDIVLSSKQYWTARDFTKKKERIHLPLWLAREFLRVKGDESIVRLTRGQRSFVSQKARLEVPKELIKPLGVVVEAIEGMTYYSASQFINPSRCPVSFEIEVEHDIRRPHGLYRHSHGFLFDLYSVWKKEDKRSYLQFFDIVGSRGIGLIDDIKFKEIPTSAIDYQVRSGGRVYQRRSEKMLIVPQFIIGGNALSPNQLSEGTFKTIALLFYLITKNSPLLLIEEPEVCVHHGLLSSILELLKTYSLDKQIIISTHSDFVLDKVAPENVYKVSKSLNTGTSVEHITKMMSKRELSALRSYMDTEGNLGEYWRHGGLE